MLAGAAALILQERREQLRPMAHTMALFRQLGRVMSGEIDRLLLMMPPRHGKSTVVSTLVSTWLRVEATMKFGLASYGEALANDLSLQAQAGYESLGGEYGAMKQKARWNTDKGGGMWATGAQGALTGRGANCLPDGTLVATPWGSVRIEDVRPGVRVLSRDPETARLVVSRVTATRSTDADELVRVETASGKRFRATPDHPVYVPGPGWTGAGELEEGHPLVALDGTEFGVPDGTDSVLGVRSDDDVRIVGDSVSVARPVRGGPHRVHDLQVEGTRCFFADGILVHNCLIFDDAVKGRDAADSQVERERIDAWYKDTFRTRLDPPAEFGDDKGTSAIIGIGTRWHEDDLLGRLIAREEAAEDPEGWVIVMIDAEHDPEALEDLRKRLPDNEVIGMSEDREEGDLLEMYSESEYRTIKSTLGLRGWSALYQQSPVPAGGLLFDVGKFRIIPAAPAGATARVRVWDLAGSDKRKADQTVGVLIAVHDLPDGRLWVVEDVRYGRWSLAEREAQIKAVSREDGPFVQVLVEEDVGVGGAARTRSIISAVAPYMVESVRATGSKVMRAEPFAAQVEAGNVALVQGRWLLAYTDELRTFPAGKHDDFTDSSAHGFNWLAEVDPSFGFADMYGGDEEEEDGEDEQEELAGWDALLGGVVEA